jgi:RNA polymerase sigma-70 factor, ECF subfamily
MRTEFAKMPVNKRIPHSLSYFRVVFRRVYLWHGDCFLHRRVLFYQSEEADAMEGLCSTCINKVSDSELVAATKCGNAEAFEQLVFRHERRVLAVAQRIVNNREDAEDVTQECFHKAFLHLSAFQEKSRFSTWLTRIALNEAYMVLRRRRRIIEVLQDSSDDDVKSIAAPFVDHAPNPEESCRRQERIKLLTEAINRLSPKLRRAILLYDIEEHSVNETAQILGTSIAAVKSRLNHGREKLRGRMIPGHQFEICASVPHEALC